jgi:hypothetical protein
MKTLKYTLLIALCMITMVSSAQTNVKFKINHKLGSADFSLNTGVQNNLGHDFELFRMQYYVSSISIVHDTGKVTPATGVYLLVDASKEVTFDLGSYDVENIEAINFSIGVNSPENNEDPTQWPTDHPLYPKAPSMHWGWASGYRFVAMEGEVGENLNTMFQIHALGNQNYFKISIPAAGQDVNGDLLIEINADYTKAVEDISISSGVVTHGDFGEAVQLLHNFRDHVYTSMEGTGNTLSVKDEAAVKLAVYPNPSAGNVSINTPNNELIEKVVVRNVMGQEISVNELTPSSNVSLHIEEKGMYFLDVYLRDQKKLVKKVTIL